MLCITGYPEEYLKYQLVKRGHSEKIADFSVRFVENIPGVRVYDDDDYERLAKAGEREMRRNRLALPFKVSRHDAEYTSYPQVSFIEIHDVSATNSAKSRRINTYPTEKRVVVCNDIERAGRGKHNIEMLDLSKVDEQTGAFLLENWKEDMPISMFAAITGHAEYVKDAFFTVTSSRVKRWTGKVYAFGDDNPVIRRHKVKKIVGINTLPSNGGTRNGR